MASKLVLLALCLVVAFCIVECSVLRSKRSGGYGHDGYGNKYGPYYDKYDFYYGIPGFNVYSKYGQGGYDYGKAVFASEHGYGYGGYGGH